MCEGKCVKAKVRKGKRAEVKVQRQVREGECAKAQRIRRKLK